MTAIQKITPAQPMFGADKPGDGNKPPASSKPGPVTADQLDVAKPKRGPLIQGGLMSGIGRGFRMYLRPVGFLELIADIACMMTGVTMFVPPFFAKHFVEGLVGANTLFKKSGRNGLINMNLISGASKSKFHAYDRKLGIDENRTVWGALKSFITRQPDAFDTAKFKIAQAKKAAK